MSRRFACVALGLLALAAASPGHAAVRWLATPTPDDFAASYPPEAATKSLSGAVSLHCRLAAEGRLADCTVTSESPAGVGFGQAALGLASKLVLAVDADTPTELTLPLRFEPPIRTAVPRFKVMLGYEQYGAPGPFYPVRATDLRLQGAAALLCTLVASGALEECRVLEEKPLQAGFGDASLAMARKGWMTATPRTVDGQPLAKEPVEVIVPFEFRKR